MAIRKSRPYTQDDGSKVSFDFDGGKLVGMKKDGTSLNPESVEFVNLAYTDDALRAYNVSKYSSNKRSYEDSISISSKEERDNYYTTENKKETNESFVEQDDVTRDRNIATQNASPTGSNKSEVMSYPFDLNPKQDHFKIMRYNYIRPDINMSKGPDQEIARVKGAQANKQKKYGNNQTGDRIINRAGDSVVGSELKGSVLLPMPKATDVNGAEWGKSELTISGIAALGAANMLSLIHI